MPQLGETVTEGTITRWFKQVGETIEADEPLFEVSTDKVDSEVPAPSAGVVSEILVPEGETVEVGARLAVISDGTAGAAPGAGGRCRTRAGARAALHRRRRLHPRRHRRACAAPLPKLRTAVTAPPPEAAPSESREATRGVSRRSFR